jgi:hypothetical protein
VALEAIAIECRMRRVVVDYDPTVGVVVQETSNELRDVGWIRMRQNKVRDPQQNAS